MKQAICLYLHIHQPYRIRHYTIFDTAINHNYFNDNEIDNPACNQTIIKKIAQKSYLPTNQILKSLIDKYPDFKINFSFSGTALEQLEAWAPEVIDSFKDLVQTGRVEIVAETFYHSLAFFYSRDEFEAQVNLHRQKIQDLFGLTPSVFRGTELSYNNDLAYWADKAGYKGIITEGWYPILGWRSPNFVYRPAYTEHIKLLLKNYRLSDDVAFRFGDRNWSQWPLTADKYIDWLGAAGDNAEVYNLFMDYETFGEHQWADKGIFEFLKAFPKKWMDSRSDRVFMTMSEVIDSFDASDSLDIPQTITWADTERDLSAWTGNPMQQQAINAIYSLQSKILQTNDDALIEDWRRLQTSDHFYYMCTKWFNDGDIHAYFNPYDTPYEAFINFMNIWHDLRFRLIQKGIEV
jgi:alpha-amylase